MPHHKSAKKRVKTNEIRRQANMTRRSQVRHAVRDLRQAMAQATGPSEELTRRLHRVTSLLDRMSGKGILHKNTAARLKSRLSSRMPA